MPICPDCRTGYDAETECPECGTEAPARITPAPSKSRALCSDLGIFCIFCAWLGSIVALILFIIAAIRINSELLEWGLTLIHLPLYLGVSYALWIALKLATGRTS